MKFYFPNVDPVFLYQRKGTEDDPYIFLQDTNIISPTTNTIVLKEVPSFNDKVKATVVSTGEQLTEIGIKDHITNRSQFRVDYSVGIVHFHEDLAGLEVKCEYMGTGHMFISSHRIRMETGDNDPVKTLHEALIHVEEGVRTLEEVGNLEFKGDYNPNLSYRKWNFVTYGNKTYVALQEVQGEEPNTSNKWTLVSSGVAWVGVYDENKTYSVGDMVADSKSHNLYMSNIDNNSSPLSNSDHWSVMVSVDGQVAKVDDKLLALESQFNEKIDELSTTIDTKTKEFDTQISSSISNMNNFVGTKSQELVDLMDYAETEEDLRSSNESKRQANEQQRIENENERQQAHQLRNIEHANALDELEIITKRAETTISETEQARDNAQTQADRVEEILPKVEGFEHMGEYNPDMQYRKNNLVTYAGSTYQAIQDVKDISPMNRDYWVMVAQKGMDGRGLISTIEGRYPDENGNIELSGLTVTSVNGQVGDVTIDISSLDAETPDGAQAKVDAHAALTDNPHRVNKHQVGLGNVENVLQASKEEFDQFVDRTDTNIGNLKHLHTFDQGSLVAAINELVQNIEDLRKQVQRLEESQ